MPRILVIDDEHLLTEPLLHHFSSLGWDATAAENGESGISSAKKLAPDIILLDMKLPDLDGIDILKRLNGDGCTASVVIMTGCGSIPNAVEAIKLGAEHYLTKPVELAELSTLMDRIMEMRKLRLENRYYQQLMDNPVVGVSMAIQKLHHMIDLMAENADTTVLLLGESGTGKELVAREIHRRSRRSERLFLDINCAVLSETLLESEMFGHERGAFTDAREFKRGLLEVADGGTVFLDEIGEMPLSVQPKLLRVLETHSFKRVGATKDVHVNVRIIAATNKDLSRAVAGGRFREDLFYRLKVFPVHLPPLRERQEDIPALEDHFVNHFNATLKKNITGFTPEARDLLKNYAWPGNVRELKNVVERAMVLSKVTAIGTDLLPREISGFQEHAVTGAHGAKGRSSDRRPLADMERDYIVEVFHHEKKNRTTTARVLGISRSTLQMKLKKYGIT
jgi:DNA-binding NtrC family response regulator